MSFGSGGSYGSFAVGSIDICGSVLPVAYKRLVIGAPKFDYTRAFRALPGFRVGIGLNGLRVRGMGDPSYLGMLPSNGCRVECSVGPGSGLFMRCGCCGMYDLCDGCVGTIYGFLGGGYSLSGGRRRTRVSELFRVDGLVSCAGVDTRRYNSIGVTSDLCRRTGRGLGLEDGNYPAYGWIG